MTLPQPPTSQPSDTAFQQEVERLYRLTVWMRWLVVMMLWLTVGAASLWALRDSIALLRDYFTWAAVRYSVIFQRVPAIGLAFCIGMTTAVLSWQSRNLLFGLPLQERQHLERQVQRIRQQGSSHPLWHWVCKP
jgi:hypothetical protein